MLMFHGEYMLAGRGGGVFELFADTAAEMITLAELGDLTRECNGGGPCDCGGEIMLTLKVHLRSCASPRSSATRTLADLQLWHAVSTGPPQGMPTRSSHADQQP